MNTDALDFIVINAGTGAPVAAFLLPTDALCFIKARRDSAHGRQLCYDLVNKDGSPVSYPLALALERVNALPGAQVGADESPMCPHCIGGEGRLVVNLGAVKHFRCPACGGSFLAR